MINSAIDDDEDDLLASQSEESGTQEKKLVTPATWIKKPTVMDLKRDLQVAKPYHDTHITKIDGWLDNLYVRGKTVQKNKNASNIVPKLIRKQAEWRYAALSEPFLSTPDIFNINPVTWEDKQAAYQNELVLNYQFNTAINKTTFIDEYVRTVVDEGTVIVRVNWEYAEKEVIKNKPVFNLIPDPSTAEMHQQLVQMKSESPSQYDTDVPEELKAANDVFEQQGVPTRPQITGYQQVKEMVPLYNRPGIEVCNTKNIYIDPTCMGDLNKASFVIYSYESSKAELIKEGRYANIEQIRTDSNSILGQPDHTPTATIQVSNLEDEARKKFVVYEYWGYYDVTGSGMLTPIVASWVGDVLIRLEENPYPDQKLPFVLVQYLPVRKGIYGEPDGVLIEDNQQIIGAVTRGIIDTLGKSANGQTGIQKGLLDATNRYKFESGKDYEFNPIADPRVGIHMHTFPEIPQSAQFMIQLQNMEAESLTGVKSFNQGISGQSLGEVAAGVRGALDAASKRELGILRRLSVGIIEIGRKIIAMNSQFLDEKEVVRVTNEQFVEIRRDDLAGNFDLRLSISTPEEDNNKAQELSFMLQTVGNNMDIGLTKMILSNITKLRKMPDLAKQIESFEPQPDPLMQKKAELEIQLLEAQIATEIAKAEEARVNAQLLMNKAGTELAKADNLSADTDKKALDFVEQESGVTQERNKELHGEQARSQAQLKVMDNQMQMQKEKFSLVKEFVKANAKAKDKPTSK